MLLKDITPKIQEVGHLYDEIQQGNDKGNIVYENIIHNNNRRNHELF